MEFYLLSHHTHAGKTCMEIRERIFFKKNGAKKISKNFFLQYEEKKQHNAMQGSKGENRHFNSHTLPIKAEFPPNLAIPTATLAGAPPGAFLKPGASASETPATVGTKSIKISPKQTTSELSTWRAWTDTFVLVSGTLDDPI